VNCQKCGAALPEGARFCPACGTSTATQPAAEERKLVTILFADLAGFTGLGERLDAERLKEVMDAYFGAMREEIEAEGGTVEKFIGDAVMAVFGVPVAHEDDPSRASRAALHMQSRLSALNEDLARSHGLALEIRIGVNTGEVLAVTDPKPGEAMVAGDAVNVAARLQQHGDPGQILVAERAARATRGFRFEEVPPLSLKGKGVMVRAFRLVEESARPEPGVPGLRAPLIGRDPEMALLDTIYDRVTHEGRPNLVSVYGDPGVGKSRLVAEFNQRAERRADPPLLLTGRCLPYGDGVTYWPLAEVLKGLAAVLDSDPAELVVTKIRKLGEELLTPDVTPDPARATAALAYTVGVEDPEVPFRDLPPRQVRLETHTAWRSFLSGLASHRTIVVTIEDIHWADAAMLDLLEDVAERAQGPILIICPARPELTQRRPTWGGGRRNYTSIFIDPLTARESEELVGSFLTLGDLPVKLRRQILDHAEGNPFFLEEIVRQLIDEGHLVQDEDGCRATSDAAEVIVPDTVQGVLAARIDLLSPAEKRVLQVAAVVGRVFWPGVVRTLIDREDIDVDAVLDRLDGRELVRARLTSSIGGDREYIFKHILTREVGYESIPRRERGAAHARVARWLENMTRGREREFAELLAHHFVQASGPSDQSSRTDAEAGDGLRLKALEYLLLASEVTSAKLVLTKAQQLAEQALLLSKGPLERSRALLALGISRKSGYQGDLAWANLREAVDERVAAAPDDHEGIVMLVALALEVPTRWPGSMQTPVSDSEAARYLRLGLDHAQQLPPGDSEALVRLLSVEAFWPYGFPEQAGSDEELEAAEMAGRRAAEIAQRLGRPDLESGALDGAQSNIIARDMHGHVESTMDRRLELTAVINDPWELGDTFAMASWSSFMSGRYRDAIRYAAEGIERTAAEAIEPEVHCRSWSTLARYRIGDWRSFFIEFNAVLELLGERRTRPPHYVRRLYATAALVHDIQGNLSAANEMLAKVTDMERVDRSAPPSSAPWVSVILARRGKADEALKRLSRAENTGASRTFRGLILEARLEVIGVAGMWARASGAANDARIHGQKANLLALPPAADRLEGMAALAERRIDDATRLLEAAGDRFDELEMRWDGARADLSLAEALHAAGEAGAARARLRRATEWFEELGAVLELGRARELAALLD
jgi:class 3 adenylate cyclase/tetratricopeptide (TPR) repeat protein